MTGIRPVGGSTSAGLGYTAHPHGTPVRRSDDDGTRDGRGRPADWQEALSELEGEVLAAEETLTRGSVEDVAAWGRRSEDWIPPQHLGPLPDDLRVRALRLLQHQLAVAEALVERITQAQRQRDVAARMSYGPSRPIASFIDRAL